MTESIVTFGIVEDEVIERDAMRLFIESSFPDARVLWTAEDGQSGLEAWKREAPQILIVDIHMPIMDGLTLCERLNALPCDSVIVINTAYDSFAYARRAIALRAFDYIVKPADNAELEKTLRGCIAEARRRQAISRRKRERSQTAWGLGQLTVSELFHHPRSAIASRRYLEPLGWPPERNYQTRVIHFVSPVSLDAERMHTLEATLGLFPDTDWLVAADFVSSKRMVALLDSRQPMEPQKMYTLLWMYGKYHARHSGMHIRISDICADKAAIAHEIAWTTPASLEQTLDMPRRSWRLLRAPDAERLTHTLARFFADGQFPRALRYLEETCQVLTDPALEWEAAQWTFLAMLDTWPDRDILDAVAPLCRADDPGGDVCSRLIRYCETLPALDAGDVIDRALEIMKTEFGADLSQSALALRLGLEQGYFSRLFKKRCGQNFSQALTEIRMRHAEKLLLQNPEITLDELCRECGLSSKTYFSEAFKKWKGMTITQFLRSQRE